MVQSLTNLSKIDLDSDREQQLASAAKALSHPARIRLLKILANRECLGIDLVNDIGLAQSTVSEHLRILREAGFVKAEVKHPGTCFSLNPKALEQLRDWLNYLG